MKHELRLRRIVPSRRRSGMVLVAALVCLLILTAMIGTMLETSLRARRQLRTERDLIQCELLLEAGMDRAAFRLSTDGKYEGETWNLPADAVGGRGDGQVTIEATREAEGEPWNVRVVAEYPVGSEASIRRSKTIKIPL